jgi:hypothetical protein
MYGFFKELPDTPGTQHEREHAWSLLQQHQPGGTAAQWLSHDEFPHTHAYRIALESMTEGAPPADFLSAADGDPAPQLPPMNKERPHDRRQDKDRGHDRMRVAGGKVRFANMGMASRTRSLFDATATTAR